MILKLLAHLVTCTALSGYLKLEFELAGAKFWFIYILMATLIWIMNNCFDK